ncbi:MAG: hypothetical protein AB1938_04520 [Myxococcota bacterium]
MTTFSRVTVAVAAVGLVACNEKHDAVPVAAKPQAVEAPAPRPVEYKALSRLDFNRRAQERFVPLFWRQDTNGNGALDVDELAVLVGPWEATRADFVDAKGFTKKFADTYAALEKPLDDSKLSAAEKTRRELLAKELEQGKPTLVETDLSQASDEEREVFAHLERAADRIEVLYAREKGTFGMAERIPADDVLSRAVFHRNQSPFCVAPKTEKDEACTALSPKPPRVVGLYPAKLQEDPKFCAVLEKQKNKKDLMDHFSVVVEDGAGFKAVPFAQAWKDDMEAVAKELDAAAQALKSPGEEAFRKYLAAAAAAFRTNDFEPANEAWVAMDATNSKWYARIAPDEVYYEPCAWKAGFALQLARINPESLAWQQKLEPVKQDMEKALATLAGPPYKARDVKFKLPDFIDVVLNAGDQRNPHGATIGQSLPNWGKVSEKGGRTVVMTNLYTDADSREALGEQMKSLLCPATFALGTTDPKPALMSVVLHEAAHNLGPSHDYAVKGKKDDDVFGGPLAATMEELKAQTSALYFAWWLAEKGVITKDDATKAAVRDVAWGFGHVSRGMYAANGQPRNYSQLASIQLGNAFKAGALTWKKDEKAANGQDVGCFELDVEKWKTAVDRLAKRVLMAKGKGDKKDAEKMKADFVDAKDEWAGLRDTIAERWLRAPKATFVYSVKQ